MCTCVVGSGPDIFLFLITAAAVFAHSAHLCWYDCVSRELFDLRWNPKKEQEEARRGQRKCGAQRLLRELDEKCKHRAVKMWLWTWCKMYDLQQFSNGKLENYHWPFPLPESGILRARIVVGRQTGWRFFIIVWGKCVCLEEIKMLYHKREIYYFVQVKRPVAESFQI